MLTINSTSKNADDVVITLAIRTPLAKGFKGGFKDTQFDFLVYSLLKQVIQKSKLDPQLVEDICCGNVSLLFLLTKSHTDKNRSTKAKPHTLSALPLSQRVSPTQLLPLP